MKLAKLNAYVKLSMEAVEGQAGLFRAPSVCIYNLQTENIFKVIHACINGRALYADGGRRADAAFAKSGEQRDRQEPRPDNGARSIGAVVECAGSSGACSRVSAQQRLCARAPATTF